MKEFYPLFQFGFIRFDKAFLKLNSKSRSPHLFGLMILFLLNLPQTISAQTTTITTEAGTGYTLFAQSTPQFSRAALTFVIENTNNYNIVLTGIDMYWNSTNSTLSSSKLWYSATSLSGAPTIATPDWTQIASAPSQSMTASGYRPTFTNLSMVIPANTQYRFAVDASLGLSYSTNPAPTIFTSAGVTLKVSDSQISGSNVGYLGTFPSPTTTPAAFAGRIKFQQAAPCTAPPTPGQAVSSALSVCASSTFRLSLTGQTGIGLGSPQTYQWQASPNGTTNWTNITGATDTAFTTSQSASTFYRAVVTCSGQSANSGNVQVLSTGTPLSGIFTIDKNNPASSTNFQSFSAAITAFSCAGISGPVIFNVTTGSGPYNEQVIIPLIMGASSTNTITFNGNGNTVSAIPGTTDQGVITLNNADYVKFDNFIVTVDPAATRGWGVQLKNTADYNSFTNNTFNINLTSNSTNFNGIVAGTSTTSSGNNASNTLIENNIINGGYYGIAINGGTGATAIGNQIINNEIKDSYLYAIRLSNTDGSLVERNDISRPTRTVINNFFYSIYLDIVNKNGIINRNRIHNTFGGVTNATQTFYGIYSNNADAPVGSEMIVKNNLIYGANTSGNIYGIYNANGEGTYYYNNTIDISSATNNMSAYGFYFTQGPAGPVNNVKFINNIVTLNATAAGTKSMFKILGSGTNVIVSNHNAFFVSPIVQAQTTTSVFIGEYLTNQAATLTAWQAINNNAFDQNSVFVDPGFANISNGNFQPSASILNNAGLPLPVVSDDFTGAIRNPIPDIGAYEFGVPQNDISIGGITTTAGNCNLSNQEVITITLENLGSNTQTTFPVSYSIYGGSSITETFTGNLLSGTNTTYSFITKANFATKGAYKIIASANLPGDLVTINNTDTLTVVNATQTTATVNFDFETASSGIDNLSFWNNPQTNILEGTGASNGASSTKGLIMEGKNPAAWVLPTSQGNPWTINPDYLSKAIFCIPTAGGTPSDSLILYFDLKQLFKGTNLNTNFRVTVNGTQVGPTHRPPFDPSNPATPVTWKRIKVDLTPLKAQPLLTIGLESSVSEGYGNGTGTANLIDNIQIMRISGPTGLAENYLASQIKLYPNPSNGTFKISLPSGEAYSLEVTDLTGKTILKQKANGNVQVKMENAAKGIYILKVTGEDNMATKKLIIE